MLFWYGYWDNDSACKLSTRCMAAGSVLGQGELRPVAAWFGRAQLGFAEEIQLVDEFVFKCAGANAH